MAGSFRWLFFLWVLTVFDAFDIFLTPCKPGSQGLIFLGADWFASVSKNCQKPSSGLRLRFQRFWMLSTYGDAARHPLAVDSSRFFDGFWHLTLLTVLTPCQPGLPEKIRGIDKASCRGLSCSKQQNQQVSCSSHLSHFCLTCLTCSKNSQIPVLCLSHLSQSLSQFVSMEAVIPENRQICQFFFVFVSVVSVSTEGFMQENSQTGPFCVCLTCLTCLTCLRGALWLWEKKHRSVWADQYPFGQTSANPNPPKKIVGPPHLLGQTSTKQTPSTRWASQYLKKKNPPRPVGQTSTFKKKEYPPDPLGRPVPIPTSTTRWANQ